MTLFRLTPVMISVNPSADQSPPSPDRPTVFPSPAAGATKPAKISYSRIRGKLYTVSVQRRIAGGSL
jgi:hypothetical protein